MRVTDQMISNRVVFNMQRSLTRFFDLETQTSSGRRINKASDDPTGSVRDLDYRAELAAIAQHRKNISQGLNWTSTYDQVINDATNFVSSAKEIAVAMSNDTYDDVAREASASEIRSIIDQLVTLSNTQLEGRSIFGGVRTRNLPFTATPSGVEYAGDTGAIRFEIDNGQQVQINLAGQNVFLDQLQVLGEDSDLNAGVSATTNLADLHSGNGIDQAVGTFTVTDDNLGISSTIDITGATTLDDVLTAINTQLTADGITNVTAELGDEGNNIVFRTTENGLLTGATELDLLHGGSGISRDPGIFRVSDGGAIDFNVDVSGAATMDDIITAFNSAATAAGVSNVTMSLNAAGTGFQVDDANGVPLGLQISDINESGVIASQLGITGVVGSQLIGLDLNPAVSFTIAETTGTTAADLGLIGTFNHDVVGSDLDVILTPDALLDNLNNGNGLDRGELIISQGSQRLTFDLSDPTIVTVQDLMDRINSSTLDVTAEINANGTGIQIVNDDLTKSLTVEDGVDRQTAKDLGLYGSSDMMGTLMVLANSLENNDADGASQLLKELEYSVKSLLNTRGFVGSQAIRLETTDNRLVDMQLDFTRLLSETEDVDIAEALTQLATYETNYQSALMASAKIIQPSLLDFLI